MDQWRNHWMMALVAVLGCGGDGDRGNPDSETGALTEITTADDGGEDSDDASCPPGAEGCVCDLGGVCAPGLWCEAGFCAPEGGTGADEGSTTGAPKPDQADSTSGETGDGSCAGNCGQAAEGCFCDAGCLNFGDCCDDFVEACPGSCLSNADCAPAEVCSFTAAACVPAYGSTYEVRVDAFADQSPTCWDVDDCLADIYYEISVGGTVVYTSSVVTDTVSTSWAVAAEMVIPDDQVWTIRFWDSDDLSPDDPMTSKCWTNSAEQCWVVPEHVLHAGGWVGELSGSFALDLRFAPK